MQLQCGIIYSSWPRALENAAQTIRQNLLLARATETHPQPLLCSSSLSFLPFSPKIMGPFASGPQGCWEPPPRCSSRLCRDTPVLRPLPAALVGSPFPQPCLSPEGARCHRGGPAGS